MFDVNIAVTANDRTNIGRIASPKDWRRSHTTLQAMQLLSSSPSYSWSYHQVRWNEKHCQAMTNAVQRGGNGSLHFSESTVMICCFVLCFIASYQLCIAMLTATLHLITPVNIVPCAHWHIFICIIFYILAHCNALLFQSACCIRLSWICILYFTFIMLQCIAFTKRIKLHWVELYL